MTKCAHFIPVKSTYKTEDYAKFNIDKIVRWNVIPLSTILNMGAQFTSHFWRSFKKSLDTQVKLSNAFHPQTDGQEEHTIQNLEDMLRACVIDFKGTIDDQLTLIEFSYNHNYHSSVVMEPFEAL